MRRVGLLVLLLGLLPVAAHAAGAEGVWRYDTAKMSAEVDSLAAAMVAKIGPAKLQAMASRAPMLEERAAAMRARAPGDPQVEAQAARLEQMAKSIEAAQGDPKAFFRDRLNRLDSPEARLTLRAGGACETLLPGPRPGSPLVKKSCRWTQAGQVVTVTSNSIDTAERPQSQVRGPIQRRHADPGDRAGLGRARRRRRSHRGRLERSPPLSRPRLSRRGQVACLRLELGRSMGTKDG